VAQGTVAPAGAQTRHAAIVVDANTGTVLHEQLADAPRHPASLTKMMTLYIVFEEIEQGRLSYTSKIPISARAASVAPSKLNLEPGEEIELLDAVKALIVKSANDVAVAVAEHIGGSEAGFVRMMNEHARRMGLDRTVFTNASGLPDAAQVTSARDMVTLAMRLSDDFPRQYQLFSLKSFDFRGKTYRTHNSLLRGFPGVDGVKTGYTRASGYNLVSSVQRDGKHVVAALFGGVTATTRNAHMRSLLFRALQRASSERTRKPPTPLTAPARTPPSPVASSAEPQTVWKTETRKALRPAAAPQAPKPPRGPASRDPETPAPSAAAPRPETAEAPPSPRISMAKVRAVTLAPDGTAPVPAEQSIRVEPKLDLMALREAISSAAEGAADEPPGPNEGAPATIEDIITRGDPAPPLDRLPPTPGAETRRLASSPGSKAIADAAPSPPAVAATAPPSPSKAPARTTLAAAPVGHGYEIQIGAYASAAEAENRLAFARSRAGGLLDGHTPLTLPVQKGDRQIFRARFGGFGEDGASNACLELRRLAIDCFVMKAD
jgi:D-alanyl-D-alanine carboxypeptidase